MGKKKVEQLIQLSWHEHVHIVHICGGERGLLYDVVLLVLAGVEDGDQDTVVG